MKELLERYRRGEAAFDAIEKLPDWGRLVNKARRLWPCPPWVTAEELRQEALTAVWQCLQPARLEVEAWDGVLTYDPAKSEVDRFVVAQVFWRLRRCMRRQAHSSHGPKHDVGMSSELHDRVVMGASGRDRSGPSEVSLGAFVAAPQESEVARRMAVAAMDDEVRRAVEELFSSGSVERAVQQFAYRAHPKFKKKRLLNAARRVYQETRL